MTSKKTAVDYHERVLDPLLDDLLDGLPAIALQGAKGVGKTATAERRASVVHALDDPVQREAFEARPLQLPASDQATLIDEWQLVPSSWDAVRRAVDHGAGPGSFLLAGSSAPADARIHSGAGRIYPLRMRPLSLAERDLVTSTVSLADLLGEAPTEIDGDSPVGLETYVEEILATGLPGIRPLPERMRRRQIESYIEWAIQREFAEQGVVVRRPATLREWLAAYAAATATTAAYTRITEAATPALPQKPSSATTMTYRDVLSRAFLLDPLEPWSPKRNHMSRLASSPKHFLLDPGIAARLLGASKASLLEGRSSGPAVPRDGTLLGALFEHLVTMSVQTYAQANEARCHHLRLHDGRREVDLLVERDNKLVALEIKLTPSVKDDDVRHLHWLKEHLGDDVTDAAVITTGPAAYRRPDGIAVIPAALLGP
jgi:uncharacterized protein